MQQAIMLKFILNSLKKHCDDIKIKQILHGFFSLLRCVFECEFVHVCMRVCFIIGQNTEIYI